MKEQKQFKYPGIPTSADGNTVAIMCERESTDGAGAYPITPSTQMGEYWAVEADNGHLNISGRPLIFIEPEGEHAAAGVTAGLSMTGLRATNFSSGQGIAYMHESLYAAVGKRLTYVLNVGCRAITKASLNVHAAHDDYHAVDDTGFFQLMARDAQQVADLNVIAHRIAELALTPGLVGQDGFLTTHLIESLVVPEREMIAEYLGRPDDIIESPTPAQKMLYGETRRRIPELWSVDDPVLAGPVQNQDAYMQSVAAQRPFFFDHVRELTERAMEEFHALTGRRYGRVLPYRIEDADYVIVGMGSLIPSAEVVADYLRNTRKLKVGVLNITMYRPFPGELLGTLLKGKKGVAVLERTDQPLAEDLPLIREIRAALGKCVENGMSSRNRPWPEYERFTKLQDMPQLYSGSYGLGSRDLQPEGIIGAVENMLPEGKGRRNFYLGVDFIRDVALTPKEEIHQQQIVDYYPHVKDLAVHGSENPNLLPANSITVRIHSVGGWGAMATGKNLTMTLADILGFYIKSNPKYGSEKKGQPTTYYLSVAPEPIKINCEYFFVDVVLSPDPNVFKHSNPLAGLKRGGIFIIQSDCSTAEEVWASIPKEFQDEIIEREFQIYYLDAFRIAKEEASDPELQFRMQGIAFQGAFFAASPVMQTANLTEEQLFERVEAELQSKFGSKGARVVEDNLRVVRRGYDATVGIDVSVMQPGVAADLVSIPDKMKLIPVSQHPGTDIHRFWEQTGYFYKTGKGNDILADPYASMSLIPAATGVFKDMTYVRFEYPEFVAENCTGCGDCWVICPDSAIPGLVNDVSEVFETAIKHLEREGHKIVHLRRSVRTLESKLRALIERDGEASDIHGLLENAIDETLVFFTGSEVEKSELIQEYILFKQVLDEFRFSVTRPFYTQKEKELKGSGGLLSVTVNPYTCKGCMECVAICGDDALRILPQTESAIETMRENWRFWNELPNTSEKFIRIDDLDEGIGALETLLLNKENYEAMVGGDGACLGCGEKTVMHLFASTVTALMQPRVKKQVEKIDDLVTRLEARVRERLSVNISDTDQLSEALTNLNNSEFTIAELNEQVDSEHTPLDAEWLRRVTDIIAGLKKLRWQYTEGVTGRGRSQMGIINATGCTSVWGSTYPINPYPFPWANHLFQDSPSVAMGLFEGHMDKMAEGFKWIRRAEHALENAEEPDLTYFNWEKFTDEEFLLCPPVVAVGGDGAMYDIGFQNLSRMLMSGKPIKTMVVDTQVYSNTGGQACTSGFIGQVSDMATFGDKVRGKTENRKEISLIGMAHRTAYILQSSSASIPHLIEGFIQGLNSRRPALFNIYTACQPEHGVADDLSFRQAKLALESRAYPFVRYNPDLGNLASECFDLDGNPDLDSDWPSYPLKYLDDDGNECTMEIALTFADFAASEARFRKHFKAAPRETWSDETMVPIAEYLRLDEDDREDVFPFVWTTDSDGHLGRSIVTDEIVKSTEERLNNWRLLKELAGVDRPEMDEEAIANTVRVDMISRITGSLVKMATEHDGNSSSETKTVAMTDSGSAVPDTAGEPVK